MRRGGGGGGGCSSHLPLPWREEALADSEPKASISPLHDPVTWYKITHARTQVAQWDFQNKATHTTPLWRAFDLEVPLCNLRPCMSDFVLCERIEQRDYCCFPGPLIVKKFPSQSCQEIDRTKKLSAAEKKEKQSFTMISVYRHLIQLNRLISQLLFPVACLKFRHQTEKKKLH